MSEVPNDGAPNAPRQALTARREKGAAPAVETRMLRALVIGISATGGLMLLPEVLPPRTLDLLAADFPGEVYVSAYDDWHGPTVERGWLGPAGRGFYCRYPKRPDSQYCGITFKFSHHGADWTLGRDLSSYSAIEMDLGYQGKAKTLWMNIRNYDPRFSVPTDGNSGRPHSVALRGDTLRHPFTLRIKQLTVPEWWVLQRELPLDMLHPSFENVVGLSIDLGEDAGGAEHLFALRRLRLTGDWIDRETLYRGILFAWLGAALWTAARAYLALRRERLRLLQLASKSTELEVRQRELEDQANRDALTGLFNRRGLHRALPRPGEASPPLGVILLDIDHFKKVNDEHGHDAGDRALATLAQVLLKRLRAGDVVARWGGEEFVAVCPTANLAIAARVAEGLRRAVAEASFSDAGVDCLTISLGVAHLAGGTLDEATLAAAITRADAALYRAKAAGRNRVEVDAAAPAADVASVANPGRGAGDDAAIGR